MEPGKEGPGVPAADFVAKLQQTLTTSSMRSAEGVQRSGMSCLARRGGRSKLRDSAVPLRSSAAPPMTPEKSFLCPADLTS